MDQLSKEYFGLWNLHIVNYTRIQILKINFELYKSLTSHNTQSILNMQQRDNKSKLRKLIYSNNTVEQQDLRQF